MKGLDEALCFLDQSRLRVFLVGLVLGGVWAGLNSCEGVLDRFNVEGLDLLEVRRSRFGQLQLCTESGWLLEVSGLYYRDPEAFVEGGED